MKLSNTRTLSVTLFLIAGIIISVAATKPANEKIIAAKVATDTGFFKNLKVLPKDISKEKLDMIMDHFKEALGVRCNFCHAMGTNGHPDFASDAKEEKDIARYMMKMTSEINMKYFNSENSTMPDTISVVRCITCHHGNPHPDEAGMGMDSSKNHDMPMPPNGAPPPPPGTPPPNDSMHQMAPPPPNQ